MEGEVPQVGKKALECILCRAMSAAKNLGAQRDRLLQLRLRLRQQRSPGDDDDAGGVLQEVASGLHKVYSQGLDYGARYLADCLEFAAENGDRASFSLPAFTVIPNEQLYGVLLAQWHRPRPTAQFQAFARIKSAYYAVMLSMEHHLPRCVELLVGVRPPSAPGKQVRTMVGYSDDLIAAANEHLFKIFEAGFPDPDPEPAPEPAPDAAATGVEAGFPDTDTEPALDAAATGVKAGFPDLDPAPAAATGKPPQEKSSVDVDQALSYLHRACSLTSLAVKNMDVAVAFISSILDPEEVAKISEWADERTYISEDGPYPSDNSD